MVTAVASEIALRSRSPIARGRYIETTQRAARGADHEDPRLVVESSISYLQLFYLGAVLWEYVRDHDLRSMAELREQITAVDRHVRAAFPDFATSEPALRKLVRELASTGEAHASDWPEVDWSQLVRSLDAVVAECPIDVLEQLAKTSAAPELAHRARTVYDALRAFVRRHDPGHATVMRIVGEQYRRGHLRLQEVAQLLGMSASDAVFELEQDGYARPPEAIALDAAERAAIYHRLRQQRLARSGPPVVDPELVERDVIASERIEGVDARAWIRRR